MANTAMGGDAGETPKQTMKEEGLERLIKEKVESVAGAGVAQSAQVDAIAEKVADAVGDKVPTSVLGGAGMKSAESAGTGGLMAQAQGMMGGAGAQTTGTAAAPAATDAAGMQGLMDQAQGMLGKK